MKKHFNYCVSHIKNFYALWHDYFFLPSHASWQASSCPCSACSGTRRARRAARGLSSPPTAPSSGRRDAGLPCSRSSAGSTRVQGRRMLLVIMWKGFLLDSQRYDSTQGRDKQVESATKRKKYFCLRYI